MAALAELLRANRKYVGSTPCQRPFKGIKGLITSALVLAALQWDKEFKLEVDASLVRAGAV